MDHNHELSLKELQQQYHGSLFSYLKGFLLSLLLTVISFVLVITKAIEGRNLIITIVSLALLQAIVQLYYFMHLGDEDNPKWKTYIFYFMIVILLIISFGSLWIMYNLNDRMMSNMPM